MSATYRVVLVDYDDDLFDITPSSTEMIGTLARANATLEIAQQRTEEDVLSIARDADLVMIQSVRKLLTAKVIPALTKCRGIVRLGLGYDSVDVAAATQAGIPVSNVIDWCNDEVAEHAVALLMAGVRHVAQLDRSVRAGAWSREIAVPTHRIYGKTLGIIGFGRIAQAVAERVACFGLTRLAFDPYVDETTMAQAHVKKVELGELLRVSDFITIHARLTEQTHHLLGAPEFGTMKKNALIVNTSRGALIDEVALVAALETGQIQGAALDVMEQEPLPAHSPLRRLENIILVPHSASYSIEAVDTLYRSGADIAAKILQGFWVRTIVNPGVKRQAEARWGRFKDPTLVESREAV